METTKIALFSWEDAASRSSWHETDDKKPNTMCAVVCGLLLQETENIITVGLERFSDGGWRDTLTVPKRLILGKIVYYNLQKRFNNGS